MFNKGDKVFLLSDISENFTVIEPFSIACIVQNDKTKEKCYIKNTLLVKKFRTTGGNKCQ